MPDWSSSVPVIKSADGVAAGYRDTAEVWRRTSAINFMKIIFAYHDTIIEAEVKVPSDYDMKKEHDRTRLRWLLESQPTRVYLEEPHV